MNVMKRELRQNLKGFLFWCLGMLFLVGASAAKTSGMVGQSDGGLTEMLAMLPKSIQTVFGVGMVDYSTAIGVFAIVQTYIALIAAFHAVFLGVSVFGKEERDKTFEFLYVKGKTRASLLSSKVGAALVQMLLLNLLTYFFSAALVRVMDGEGILSSFSPMMAGVLVIQLVFFAAGLLLSFLTRQMKTALNLASGAVLALFFCSIAAGFGGAFGWLKWITPFAYFDGKEVLQNGFSWLAAGGCFVFCAACVGISYRLHEKRDLHC